MHISKGIFRYIYRIKRYINDSVKLTLINILTEFLSYIGLTDYVRINSVFYVISKNKLKKYVLTK